MSFGKPDDLLLLFVSLKYTLSYRAGYLHTNSGTVSGPYPAFGEDVACPAPDGSCAGLLRLKVVWCRFHLFPVCSWIRGVLQKYFRVAYPVL